MPPITRPKLFCMTWKRNKQHRLGGGGGGGRETRGKKTRNKQNPGSTCTHDTWRQNNKPSRHETSRSPPGACSRHGTSGNLINSSHTPFFSGGCVRHDHRRRRYTSARPVPRQKDTPDCLHFGPTLKIQTGESATCLVARHQYTRIKNRRRKHAKLFSQRHTLALRPACLCLCIHKLAHQESC